jgi:hypothetical protein
MTKPVLIWKCAYSVNDVNLFSNSSASEVKAPAVKATWEQTLWEQKWKTSSLTPI